MACCICSAKITRRSGTLPRWKRWSAVCWRTWGSWIRIPRVDLFCRPGETNYPALCDRAAKEPVRIAPFVGATVLLALLQPTVHQRKYPATTLLINCRPARIGLLQRVNERG